MNLNKRITPNGVILRDGEGGSYFNFPSISLHIFWLRYKKEGCNLSWENFDDLLVTKRKSLCKYFLL